MVEVVAKQRGFFDGIVREEGETFSIPDSLWKDKKRRPKWVELAAKKTAARKPPKDGSDKPPDDKGGKESETGGNHPEPQTVAEVQKETGGGKPDWRPPGTPDGDPI